MVTLLDVVSIGTTTDFYWSASRQIMTTTCFGIYCENYSDSWLVISIK